MSITAAQLLAVVAVRGADEAAIKLLGVGASADSAGTKLSRLAAGGIILAGVGLVALGTHIVKMAGDFQQATSQLVTGAGESRKNIDALRTGILQLSIDTATSWQQLTTGMFNVDSAGYTLAKGGLTVLKAAAEGAKAENADLAQTTDVLTTTMHGLHAGVSMAIPIMNSLIATERDGKMHMDDLTQAMKNVLPVSSSLRVPLADVEGALATMAESGDRGASAGTHLAMMFKMLQNPASTAAKEMKAMGLDSIKLAETMSTSLPDALTMIQNAVAKHFTPGSVEYMRAIEKILGGSKSGIAGLELLGQNFKDLGKFTRDASDALRHGGQDVENWDVIQKNFNFRLDAAKNAINVLFINIGTQLLPVLGKVLNQVTPLVVQFSDWVVKSNAVTIATQNVVVAIQNTGTVIQAMIGFYNQWQPEIQTTAFALAFFFTPAIIKSGVEAVISGAKITYSYITSLIATGFEGWAAAFKLAAFTASLVATGVQAGISGTLIATRFVISLVTTATTAYATAFALTGSVIPALYAMGVAVTASLGPIGLMIAAVGVASLAFIAMKNKSDEMQLGTTGAFDTMGNKIQRSTGRIIATSDQMKQEVAAQADEMRKRVVESFLGMANQTYSETTTLSQNAVANFQRLNGDLQSQMSSIDANIIGYWNDVANYISSHQITGTVSWRSVGGPITPGGPAGATTSHNAMGTNFWQGGMTWVGERGPEIINLPRGSQVIPNHQINNVVGSSGSSGQPIQVNINLAGHRVAQVLLPELVQAIRNKTGARI